MADILEVDSQFYPIGSTPLHLSANNNDTKTLTQLLHSYSDLSARIDLTDGHGRTPLVVALQNGRLEAAILLIKAGASLWAVLSTGTTRTALDALSTDKCLAPVVKKLAETTHLAHFNQAAVAPLLHYLPFSDGEDTRTKAQNLLTVFPTLLKSKDHLGQSVIHYAAVKGDVLTLRSVLKFSPKLTDKEPYGRTPLHVSCGKGHLKFTELILRHSSDPASLLSAQDKLNRTPLHVALYSQQLSTVQYIIQKYGSSLDLQLCDNEGHTVSTLLFTVRFSMCLKTEHTLSIPCLSAKEATWLLYECTFRGDVEGVHVALSQGAILNCFDFMQQTPLLLASKLGHVNVCRALVEGGADPNIYDESLRTPLHYAFKQGCTSVLQYLLTVESIDLRLFYETYDHPLTAEQIESLLQYYREADSPQIPSCWLDWLILAASNPDISPETFNSFAHEVASSDWLNQLASTPLRKREEFNLPKDLEDTVSNYPVLSSLTQEEANHNLQGQLGCMYSYLDPFERPCSKMKQTMKESKPFTHLKKSSPFRFHPFSQIKKRKLKQKISYFGPRKDLYLVPSRNKLTAFLRCTLAYKHFEVFESTLSQALDSVPSCIDVLFPQDKINGAKVSSLLDAIGENFEHLERSIESLGVIESYLMDWEPVEFCMDKVVLRYLIAGNITYKYAHFLSPVLQLKPFPQGWPLWYIKLRCRWYFESLGWTGPVVYSTSEEREELATFLLEGCNKANLRADSADSLDPSLLLEAVQTNCVWGVQLLLKHGAHPAACNVKRCALIEAIKHCYIPIVDLLLDAWPHTPYDDHLTAYENFFQDLCRCLLTLASHDEAAMIKKVVRTFDLYESSRLWSTCNGSGQRLLYVLLMSASSDCVELGKSLLKNAASFFCHSILYLKGDDHSKNAQKFIMSLSLVYRLHKEYLGTFWELLSVCSAQNYALLNQKDMFPCICRQGTYNIVSFFLKHLKPADLEVASQLNPLYHAALSGDHDTIKVLAEYGFKPTLPSSKEKSSPLYQYFEFLISRKRVCPHRVSKCRNQECPLHSHTGSERQEVIYGILVPSKDYLHEMLKISEFQFRKLAQILDLKIASRILQDVFSVYQCDASLAAKVDWSDIGLSLSAFIRKYPSDKLEQTISLVDKLLLSVAPSSMEFNGVDCEYVVKAGLWGFCLHMFRSSGIKVFSEDVIERRLFLLPPLTLASKHGKVEVLQSIYAIVKVTERWTQVTTLNLIQTAAKHGQAAALDFLLGQIKTDFSLALTSVVKFGDMKCLEVALTHLEHSQTEHLEEHILSMLITAALYNRKELFKPIIQLFLSSTVPSNSEEKQYLLCTTVLEAAVKHGHSSLALYALDSLPQDLLPRLSSEGSLFHSILYWCCYWGLVEVLERLPFETEHLVERRNITTEVFDCSPWECALYHGHLGKISRLANAPSQLPAWTSDSAEHGKLLIGYFDTLMHLNQLSSSSEPVRPVTSTFIEFFSQPEGSSRPVQRFPTTETLAALITTLGKYTGEFLCCSHIDFAYVLLNEEAFELLIDCLLEADLLQAYFSGPLSFAKIVEQGSVRKVQALLERKLDILRHDEACLLTDSGSLLHAAVRTRNPEMVDLILGVYGDKAPEACFRESSANEYPLYLAFALGASKVLHQSSLLRTAYKAPTPDVKWRIESNSGRGWFQHMMEKNEHSSRDAAPTQETFSFNIREVSMKNNNKVNFLLEALKHRNIPVVVSMLESSGTLLLASEVELATLAIEAGPNVYKCNEFVLESVWTSNLDNVLTRLNKTTGNDEQVLRYIKYHGLPTANDVVSVFSCSCALNKVKVVEELMKQRETNQVVKSALSSSQIENGFVHALASGSYTTAALISLESGLAFDSIDPQAFPLANQVPEPTKLIFSSVSYYNILEQFFQSVCTDSLPLAGSWLAHNWTQLESQLFVKQLGNTSYAPSNPWLIKVNGQEQTQSELLVTIDWDSFSECFLTSPLPEGVQAKHRNTPLLVEAIVFSPSVLGQICGHTGSDKSFNPLPFISQLGQLSTLIVTAQVCPSPPSFKVYGDQGFLTVSYKPSDGEVLFPLSRDTYAEMVPSPSDSGIQSSFDTSAVSSGMSEQLKDLCHYFRKMLRKVVPKGVTVGIECDPELNDISMITRALFECIEAVKLAQNPVFLYSNFPQVGKSQSKVQSPIVNKLHVQLIATDRYSCSSSPAVSVATHRGTLNIKLTMEALNDSLEQEAEDATSVLELLLEGLVECLLDAEKEACLSLITTTLSKKVLPNLSQSLKRGTLYEDFVTLSLQDDTCRTYSLHDLSSATLPQIRSVLKLANFVSSFAKLLQIFSFKQRIVRDLFSGGLQVLLCDNETTSFSAKGGHSLLKLSSSDLQNRTDTENMASVFKSVLTCASCSQHRAQPIEFPQHIPAPFVCFVDTNKSPGYLYPQEGVSNTITVQLVDFSATPLTSLPTNQCVLSIKIRDSKSQLLTASSSTDPHSKTASKDLLVNLSAEGCFKIQWTPRSTGIHDISIKLNTIPIRGSPFKVYCSDCKQAGLRRVFAGQPILCVVSHPGNRCKCKPPPIEIPSIVPVCLRSVKPFVEAARRNSTVEPRTGLARVDISESDLPKKPVEKSLSDSPHYLSMLLKHKSSSPWFESRDKEVTLFFSPDYKMTKQELRPKMMQCISLSNGNSLLKISSQKACVLNVFAACTKCQSVLTINWLDLTATVDPTPCYITPGPLCETTTTIKCINAASVEKDGYTTYLSDSKAVFKIAARDRFNNKHTSGGAISTALLRPFGSSKTLGQDMPSSHQHLFVQPESLPCELVDHQDGTYTLTAQVCIAAYYGVTINVGDQFCTLKAIEVVSNKPYAPNCQVLRTNQYTVSQYDMAMCEVALYDRFFNPCSTVEWESMIRGRRVTGTVRTFWQQRQAKNVIGFEFQAHDHGTEDVKLTVEHNGQEETIQIVKFTVLKFTFKKRYQRLQHTLSSAYPNMTPTFTVQRDNILESSMTVFAVHSDFFHSRLRVRFGNEPGIDAGGVSREYFNLLSQELVDPRYALFLNINGFYKPSQSSSINENHLHVFGFFGKIIARAIADGHQIPVRFTPAVYKSLLNHECTLDDLKIEDRTLHMSLLTILNSETEEALQELAINFTAQRSHFGAVHTVELEEGGERKTVTMENKEEFVNKLCNWHLRGCIKHQLDSMKRGFNHVIHQQHLHDFSAHELEVILSGQPQVDISFIQARTKYGGYSPHDSVIMWLWEVLRSFSQDERCQFLQFTTGCSCLPSADTGEWEFQVRKGSPDPSQLPRAATCFNCITLPEYKSKHALCQKLTLAISDGREAFLLH